MAGWLVGEYMPSFDQLGGWSIDRLVVCMLAFDWLNTGLVRSVAGMPLID